ARAPPRAAGAHRVSAPQPGAPAVRAAGERVRPRLPAQHPDLFPAVAAGLGDGAGRAPPGAPRRAVPRRVGDVVADPGRARGGRSGRLLLLPPPARPWGEDHGARPSAFARRDRPAAAPRGTRAAARARASRAAPGAAAPGAGDRGARASDPVTAYRAALYLDPTLFQPRLLLADCLLRLGQRDRALHQYREVLSILAGGRERAAELLAALPLPDRERAERRCRQALHAAPRQRAR